MKRKPLRAAPLSAAQMCRYLNDPNRWQVVDPSFEPPELRLDISPATMLSVAAANCFNREIQGDLNWDQLQGLSPRVAEVLVRHHAEALSLGGLRRLTPATARVLAKAQGRLCLNGVNRISVHAAQALAAHRGVLVLGIQVLPRDVATALARHRGQSIALMNLDTLSVTAAEALARYRGAITISIRSTDAQTAMGKLRAHGRSRLKII